jgi:amino acid adenylation domain-containing protein
MGGEGAETLHGIFEEVVRRHADRTAIEVPPGTGRPERASLTYAELWERARRTATALLPHAAPDALVAIFLPRHAPDLYAAQLGVNLAGAAFTCPDPRFPDAHLRSVLEDARAVAILTDRAGRERLVQLGVSLPPILEPAARSADAFPEVAPTDLAYVIYTSGTTGRPKGVMIEHRGVVNLARADAMEYGLGPRDRVAQVSSPAYDSSIEETWLAFAVGATLIPLDDETVRLGPDLVPWLARERITVFCPPPTLLRALGTPSPDALPDLRLVYFGGEPLTEDLVTRWAAGRRIENGYGPTECTITTTRAAMVAGRPVTIGRPIPGHAAWILDGELREVPAGEPGELCIGGVGLARTPTGTWSSWGGSTGR